MNGSWRLGLLICRLQMIWASIDAGCRIGCCGAVAARAVTVVRGPHELGSPEARARGKDWLAQDEIVEIVESAEESR